MKKTQHATRLAMIFGILSGYAIWFQACSVSNDTGIKVADESPELLLSGEVFDSQGQPVSGAEVFVELVPEPVAVTNQQGKYVVRLSSGLVRGLRDQQVCPGKGRYLSIRYDAGRELGVSKEFQPVGGGSVDLGRATLVPMEEVSLKVALVSVGGEVKPGSGLIVESPFEAVAAQSDGQVNLLEAFSGVLPLKMSGNGVAAQCVKADSSSASKGQIYIFEGTSPAGYLSELEQDSNLNGDSDDIPVIGANELVNGTAGAEVEDFVTRRFRVFHNRQARFFRMSLSRENLERLIDLETQEGGAVAPDLERLCLAIPWRKVQSEVSVPFEVNGLNEVFVQFADATTETVGPIVRIPILLDFFADSLGFDSTLGLTGLTGSRLDLAVDVPARAARMRAVTDQALLDSAPWREVSSTLSLDLRPTAEEVGSGTSQLSRTLSLQFEDVFGNKSRVFQEEVMIQLFSTSSFDFAAPPLASLLTLNQDLVVNYGPEVTGFRVAQSAEAVATAAWQTPESPFNVTFIPPSVGNQVTVCGQFRDMNGFFSTVTCRSRELNPFLDFAENTTVLINGGSGVTTSRSVSVSIYFDQSFPVARMRVAGSLTELAGAPYVGFQAVYPFQLSSGNGMKNIYLQFETIDGLQSDIVMNAIELAEPSNVQNGSN